MQYQAKTPQEYLKKLEDDWRKSRLEAVREMIKRVWPDVIEGIEYSMLCYGDDSKNILHLNAQKAYVGLYVGNIEKVGNSEELLKGYDCGKGCIRIKKNVALEDTGLSTFISRVIEIHQTGGDTDC